MALAGVLLFVDKPALVEQQEEETGSPLNATYTVDGKQVTLVDGRAEEEIVEGSVSQLITTIFGEPAFGDVDGDGDLDAALILVQDTGGSGTFYYGAAAINEGGIYQGLNALFLGDRIVPQFHQIQGEMFLYSYTERGLGEPMSAPPSFGALQHAIVEEGVLKAVSFLTDPVKDNLLIRVVEPAPRSAVSSPVLVQGMARGYWFFEADAPLLLVNWDGLIVGEGFITAQGDWMSEELVPFEGVVEFDEQSEAVTGYSRQGTLILLKSNAAGLPEFDNSLEIPVILGE